MLYLKKWGLVLYVLLLMFTVQFDNSIILSPHRERRHYTSPAVSSLSDCVGVWRRVNGYVSLYSEAKMKKEK